MGNLVKGQKTEETAEGKTQKKRYVEMKRRSMTYKYDATAEAGCRKRMHYCRRVLSRHRKMSDRIN